MTRKRSGPDRPGFTTVELVVTLSIIIILAALIAVVAVNVTGRARIQRTRTLIATLETAVTRYRNAFRSLPPESRSLWFWLQGEGRGTHTPFTGVSQSETGGTNPDPEYLDAWGNPIDYERTPLEMPPFLLLSRGEDGLRSGDPAVAGKPEIAARVDGDNITNHKP